MNQLSLTILFPFLGFLLLAFSRGRWSEKVSAIIGVGSVALAAQTTAWVAWDFISSKALVFNQPLWTWMSIDNFHIAITMSLDGLSLTMLSVITGIGVLINIYASWYMRGEEGYSRFFAYLNLFIASMIVLVLADNLLFMYLGWEVVGLCSYLLIGFYYPETKNGAAAIKAFIVTRIGDVLLAFALFILYAKFGTLNFHDITLLAQPVGSPAITWATIMLLGGAVGKSAQLPLQIWLADAMASPTPGSALIHAATMVTAGVYLIARTHGLFLMAPNILYLVGIIGAATLVLAGFAALVQTDIKRVLAYSTMSQLGYMFLALGVQAWEAAIFHLMTHAFFKSLLFLSSGSLIKACNHEQNILKMGGLRQSMPLIYICFIVGGAALAALPLVTAGYYSKDDILWGTLINGHSPLIFAGMLGTFLTSVYIFRMIFMVFHGHEKIKVDTSSSSKIALIPLLILLVLSTVIGAQITPPLAGVLPAPTFRSDGKLALEMTSGMLTMMGLYLAVRLWIGQQRLVTTIAASTLGRLIIELWFNNWGFDWLYKQLFIKPYLAITKQLAHDPLQTIINILSLLARRSGSYLTVSVNGKIRWYATAMSVGAVIVETLLVW